MKVQILLGFALLLTACSTIQTRINQNPPAFYSMPPPDQQLILAGGIREGFQFDQVYIAWGQPDSIRRTYRKGQEIESWIYMGTQQEVVPNWQLQPMGFYCGVYYEPVYQPIILTFPYFIKAATFENGRVVEWERNGY